MNYIAIAGLTVGVSCLLFSAITFFFGKTKVHRLLLSFNLILTIWGGGLFLVGNAQSQAEAKFAWAIGQSAIFFIAPAFFHLICTWCKLKHNILLFTAYSQAVVFTIFCLSSDLIINKFRYVFGVYYIDASPLYTLSVIFYLFFVLTGYIELIRYSRHVEDHKRTQTQYVVYGFIFGFLGGSSTFLPPFGIDILHPAYNIGIAISVFVTTYAILRHNLMDITVIIKKTFSYSLVLLMLIVPCFLVVLATEKYLPQNFFYPTLACLFILVGFGFPLIKVQTERNLENILFRGMFDYKEALDKLSRKMITLQDPEALLSMATRTIARAIDTTKLGIYLVSYDSQYELNSFYGEEQEHTAEIENSSALITAMQHSGHVIQKGIKNGTGSHEKLDRELDALGAFMCIPIRFENMLRGFIVTGEKESAGDYSKEEIKVLSTMSNQLAVAIENSLKYEEINELNTNLEDSVEEIRELNINLEQKVEERTKELSKANEKLQKLDKLKSDFFSNISHELRTPLTNIILPIQNILDELGDELHPDNTNEKKGILRNANQLMKRINEILDLSRLEAGRMTVKARKRDLNNILDDIIAVMQLGADQMGIDLSFHPDPELPDVWVDEEKIEKVFMNLIGNAMKFTEQGGSVLVATQGGEVMIQGESAQAVMGSVRDTGIGISEDELPSIFERFRQADGSTSRKYAGSGLGLCLVKEFLDLHHGEIDVASKVGQGSEFTVKLRQGKDHFSEDEIIIEAADDAFEHDQRKGERRQDDRRGGYDRRLGSREDQDTINFMKVQLADLELDQANAAALDNLLAEKDPDKKSILVVEDNKDLAVNVAKCLVKSYNVDIAFNGKEALEKLKEELPDLIVSDVMMPEMDGNELCRRVKDDERTLHIPVVLLTAKAGLADKIDGLKMGADQFLAKPFNPKELLAIVESLLVQRELQAKLGKALQELKETQVQLVHSDRLETVGQLAAGIAHEMKNKMYCVRAGLDGISKRLEMLHDGKITLEDTYDGLATALDTNEKALKDSLAIVNSLLSFSRKNREGWHFAELNKGIEDTVTMVLPMVKDKIGIRLELADLPLVECSIEEINQVLMNLIINAYQAMTRPGEVNISSAQKDNYVFVIVKDNGPGIPEENIDKIFTPFYSTKPEGKNSGLGLSICYNIVIAHHGSIEVASESDKGTTFTITLPIKQPIITDTSNK